MEKVQRAFVAVVCCCFSFVAGARARFPTNSLCFAVSHHHNATRDALCLVSTQTLVDFCGFARPRVARRLAHKARRLDQDLEATMDGAQRHNTVLFQDTKGARRRARRPTARGGLAAERASERAVRERGAVAARAAKIANEKKSFSRAPRARDDVVLTAARCVGSCVCGAAVVVLL